MLDRHVKERLHTGYTKPMTSTGAMADRKVFLSGERVYVYQGMLLYDAKVLRSFDPVSQKVGTYDDKKKDYVYTAPNKKFPQKFLTETCYMVHYNGWNSKWDEWVLPARILEVNNENTMLKEDLAFQAHEEERLKREAAEAEETLREDEKLREKKKTAIVLKVPARNGKTKTENGAGTGIFSLVNNTRGRKRKADDGDGDANNIIQGNGRPKDGSTRKKSSGTSVNGSDTHYESKNGFTHHEIQSLVPDSLKILLVDDWENITKNNKLLVLPGKCTVSKALNDFTRYLEDELNDDEEEEENDIDVFFEITNSIKAYFDQCVGTFLLYRYERPQYTDLLSQEEMSHLCDVYPAIFLLRLLSIFPNILVMNNVDPITIKTSKVFLEIILFWLEQNKETYLVQEYENQSPWISLMHG